MVARSVSEGCAHVASVALANASGYQCRFAAQLMPSKGRGVRAGGGWQGQSGTSWIRPIAAHATLKNHWTWTRNWQAWPWLVRATLFSTAFHLLFNSYANCPGT